MADTIQVIRVAQVRHDASLGTTVTFFDDNDQRWAITGDVIELTEKEGKRRHKLLDPSSEYRIRWLESEWEPVDA